MGWSAKGGLNFIGKKAFVLLVTIISLIPIILIISICNDHYLIADQLGKLPPSLCSDWPTSQLTPLPQFPSATSSSTATTSTSSVVVLLLLQLVPLYSSPLTTIKSWHLSLWKAGNGGRWTPNPQVVSLPDLLQHSSGQALWKGRSCLILIYQDRRLQSYESQLTYIFLLVHIWSQGHNIYEFCMEGHQEFKNMWRTWNFSTWWWLCGHILTLNMWPLSLYLNKWHEFSSSLALYFHWPRFRKQRWFLTW